jgi:hypothetical protein
MKLKEIYDHLCYYDTRNPYYILALDIEDIKQPRQNCYCDNCFQGLDRLALEILKLKRKKDGKINSRSTKLRF